MQGVKILTVGEVVGRIQGMFSKDKLLSNLWIRGEISNFSAPRSGHWYFTLKDASSALKCVMFRSRACRTNFLPQDGLSVVIRGYVSLYARDGILQVYVEQLQADGLGALWVAFQELKAKLQIEGLFALEKKKKLPTFPQVVGIVTSPTGAAFQDMQTIIHRRCRSTKIVLAPVSVQGQEAPREIAAAIQKLDQRRDVEVIIVGRGGGSLEELWAFNTEIVARAIWESKTAIISAVGHETDYCISDWVADQRAATPSAAAEMVVPVLADLESKVQLAQYRLKQSMQRYLQKQRKHLEILSSRKVLSNPRGFLEVRKKELNRLQRQLAALMLQVTKNKRYQFTRWTEQLSILNPLAVLSRGFSVCRKHPFNEVVQKNTQVEVGEMVEILLSQGSLLCRVEEKREKTLFNLIEER